jgi:ATP-dependent helicase HrpB
VKTPLPIDAFLPAVTSLVAKGASLVLTAAPGAGKTTRLPPALLRQVQGQVLVLEPRRIAAIASAQRIAEENGWELGREVGYQVRFDNRSSRDTRLVFLTEALLMRRLLRDPELRGVGCVVLDEFHERSLHVDLALGALKELRELARPDLRLVVMSATLDPAPLLSFLGDAEHADVPGKLFPLEIRYDEKPMLLRTGPDFTEKMQRLVQKAAQEQPQGDLLVFLPGRGEIEWLRGALEPWAEARDISLFALHGQLELGEQKEALRPRKNRKVILATNVAESSLTVDGVRVVVDSGLARVSQIHPKTGFASLDLSRISKASATQRAGRAARQAPGTVYRAWIPYDELSMKDYEPAELQRSDLSESLLLLAALGVSNPESFSWFEKPPAKAMESARAFLLAIGALNPDGSLTSLGQSLRELPVHPRIAKLLVNGEAMGLGRLAAEIAALLSEPGGRLPPGHGIENDLWLRREEWKRSPSHPRNRNIERSARQLSGLLRAGGEAAAELPTRELEHKVPELLLSAYGDRLCRRRRSHEPQALMAGGRGVKLHPDSSVKASEYFLAVELSEGREASETLVYQAVGVPTEIVEAKSRADAKNVKRLEWDDEKARFYVTESREWNGLPVGSSHRRPADPSELEGKLAELALARWDRLLAANEELAAWMLRLKFLVKSGNKTVKPLTEDQLREGLELACFGETSFEALGKKSLVSYFEGLLPEEQAAALERECPSHLTVPTGNRMKIHYSEEQGPQVEVRLQELFGMKEAPRVAGQSVTLVLLGPNYRPVQVTRDLASFWKNGYPEVRKELRMRYPKHSWPEDPLTAPPVAKGRPRR